MGFKVINIQQSDPITIDSLTIPMIEDLIQSYAADVPPENFEARFNLPLGLSLDYPIINKEVVQQFYDQLDLLKKLIIDVVIGSCHKGIQNDPSWQWLDTPSTIEDLKYWVNYIVQRDFFEKNTWIYSFSNGDFESIKPFINNVIYLMILNNDHGSYNEFVQVIKSNFPFARPE